MTKGTQWNVFNLTSSIFYILENVSIPTFKGTLSNGLITTFKINSKYLILNHNSTKLNSQQVVSSESLATLIAGC